MNEKIPSAQLMLDSDLDNSEFEVKYKKKNVFF